MLFQSLIIGFVVITCLILIDFVLAVSLRLKYGDFDWSKFLNFLISGLAPYFLIWVVLSFMSIGLVSLGNYLGYDIGLEAIIPITVVINAVSVSLVLKALKSIKDKFKKVGININTK